MNPCELAKCPYWSNDICSNPDIHVWSDGNVSPCSKKEAVVEEALQLLRTEQRKKEKIVLKASDAKLLQSVKPELVVKYMGYLPGWECVKDDDGIRQIWVCGDYEVLVPMYPAFRDYSLRLLQALETLAVFEGRTKEEILMEIIN